MTAKRITWMVGLGVVLLVSWLSLPFAQLMAGFPNDYCISSAKAPKPPGATFVSQEWTRLPAEVRCEYELGGERVVRTVTPATNAYLAAYAVAVGLPLLYVALSVLGMKRSRST